MLSPVRFQQEVDSVFRKQLIAYTLYCGILTAVVRGRGAPERWV